ncbi:MAG: hypothetical protein KJS83_07490 [Xanthomonadaceae bacterium]|nr:hypothetical protein [Xanthomonadaceae bacterium]
MLGLFQKRKRQLMARMIGLASTGRLIVACAIQNDFKEIELSKTVAAQKAAAISNWLFLGTLSEEHVRSISPEEIKAVSDTWLELNPDFQELAVQTARVEATAKFGLDEGTPIEPAPVLTLYGAAYPDAPDPNSYPSLITRQLQKLPAETQASIRDWMKRRT